MKLNYLKNVFLVSIISLTTTAFVNAQSCLPNGIVFSSQQQIDDFANNYPGCTEVLGTVVIGSANINNLNGLSQLTSINSNLRITFSHNLTNLTGLNNLQSVAGSLDIESNNSLISLEGLDGLTNVGSLKITDNYNLVSFNGLNNLTTVSSQILIQDQFSITSFQGFNSLESTNTLYISNIPSLINFSGLNNLTNIGFLLHITLCNSLESLHGLESLTSINTLTISHNNQLSDINALENINPGNLGQISIHHNPSLSFCAINSLCQYITSPAPTGYIHNNAVGCNNEAEIYSMCNNISCLSGGITFSNQSEIDNFPNNYPDCTQILGNVVIQNGNITNLDGLSQITYIGGSLIINNNTNLATLSQQNNDESQHVITFGLNNLTSISNNLVITNNANLTQINGFSSLNFVGGFIQIENNNSLVDISSLQNINSTSFDDLIITNNNSLSVCEIESFCNYLSIPTNTATISNNATGCNSRTEIEIACENLNNEEHNTISVTLYPNPTKGVLYINGVSEGKVIIYDTIGRFIKEQSLTTEINLSNLNNGLYYILIEHESGTSVKSILKK